MAIIFCPECGTQVSDQAQACIKCAYPINKLNVGINNQNNATQKNYSQSLPIDKSTIQPSSGLVVAGYVVAFLSLLILPFIFLIAGIVIGIITISKGQTGHGIAHIILSIILALIGASIGGWGLTL